MSADRLQAWKDELARDPASAVFIPLVDTLRRQGRLEEARRYAIDGLDQHPHFPGAHDALARVLADLGDDARAQDEWDMALRLDPSHQASLRGLGFLAYKRRDLANAERLLARALSGNPADDGLATALRRVRTELRGESATKAREPKPQAEYPGLRTPDPKPHAQHPVPHTPYAKPQPPNDSRNLFSALLGDGDRTALLLDRDGLVLAGTYVDGSGREVSDEVGAHLGGLADEATRALQQLGLGRWESMLVEAQHATVGLAPGLEGAVVMVAAARDTQVGLVRRLLNQARQRASAWMGVAA